MGNLAKDTTETDLWAFDDVEEPVGELEIPLPKLPESIVPAPRELERKKTRKSEPMVDTEDGPPVSKILSSSKESIRLNVSKSGQSLQPSNPPVGHSAGSDFDDLDAWDEIESKPVNEVPLIPIPKTTVDLSPLEDGSTEVSPEPESELQKTNENPITDAPVTKKAEVPVAPRPAASVIPKLGLSKLERLGLICLLLLLLVGGGAAYFFTISRLPKGANFAQANDFPIAGKHVSIGSAETYWRPPVAEGANKDTFRRGTQLLPVLDLNVNGGPGAVRVFFRDENGEVVGDSVTHSVQAGMKLQIPSTAGFDDPGMYAAYRTGQLKPWTVQVFEAAPDENQGRDFKKLFEMQISAESR